MQMLKADAEREAIRRWYLLPEFERQTCEDCEAYAARLVHDLEFYTVTSRQRLIGAWLMREMFSGLTVERESYPDLYEASKQVFKQYAEVITRGQQQGSIVQGEVGGLAGVLWSLLHGVAMLIIENQMSPYVEGPEKIEHMALLSVQTLYRGMGGR